MTPAAATRIVRAQVSYVETDAPVGQTLDMYRASRTSTRRPNLWSRIRKVTR